MNNTLKWLSAIGVEYYCLEHPPKLKVCNNTELTEKPQVKLMSTKETAFNMNDKVHDNITLARSLADKANNIEELKESLLNFNGCELKKFATNTVFGDGNLEAKIMLIGEAP